MNTTERIVEAVKKECPAIFNMGDFEPPLRTAIASVIGKESWISVEERLPEDRWDEHQYPTISYPQNVVISTGKTYTAAYDREKKIWFVGNLLEYYEGKNIVDEPRIRVTHWQPLPAPPLSDLTPKTKEDGE
jgi:hypothetical protein